MNPGLITKLARLAGLESPPRPEATPEQEDPHDSGLSELRPLIAALKEEFANLALTEIAPKLVIDGDARCQVLIVNATARDQDAWSSLRHFEAVESDAVAEFLRDHVLADNNCFEHILFHRFKGIEPGPAPSSDVSDEQIAIRGALSELGLWKQFDIEIEHKFERKPKRPKANRAAQDQWTIEDVAGRREISLERQTHDKALRAGRADGCDLRFQSEHVSKHHLSLWHEDGRWWACDEHSTNGTWLLHDGVASRLDEGCPQTLRAGDCLILANSEADSDPAMYPRLSLGSAAQGNLETVLVKPAVRGTSAKHSSIVEGPPAAPAGSPQVSPSGSTSKRPVRQTSASQPLAMLCLHDDTRVSEFPVTRLPTRIGTGASVPLKLWKRFVSIDAEHIEIVDAGSQDLTIRILGRHGIELRGERLGPNQSVRIRWGETFLLGHPSGTEPRCVVSFRQV